MKRILILLILFAQVALCNSPQEAILAYQKAYRTRDFDTMWKLQLKREGLPAALLEEERKSFMKDMERAADELDFEIISESSEEDVALFVISQGEVPGGMLDLDPVFLIKLSGDWKVCERKEMLEKSYPDKKAVADKLETWFKGFKQGALWERKQSKATPEDD